MKKDVFYFILILTLLVAFSLFYERKYTPLCKSLIEYKEENKILVSVVNELKKTAQKVDTLSKERKVSYLIQDIKDMVEGVEVDLEKEEISITLPCEKMFPPGSVELSEEGKRTLVRIANVLKEMGNREIRIEGHTDGSSISGSLKEKYPTNWDLSAKRAVNVVVFLVDEVGIDPRRLSAVAYGEFRPIASNETPEGRNKNRRIVIDILPK
ncbi:MAG: OmpA family protein [candidate division WOR-3 bacterium]